jgi:hypothetical protein
VQLAKPLYFLQLYGGTFPFAFIHVRLQMGARIAFNCGRCGDEKDLHSSFALVSSLDESLSLFFILVNRVFHVAVWS